MARSSKPIKKQTLDLEAFRKKPTEQGLPLDVVEPETIERWEQGADPYQDLAAPDGVESPVEEGEDTRFSWRAQDVGSDAPDDSCPVSPRSIVEALLFVGHPLLQPLSNQQIAALMRGVRPTEVDEIVQELNHEYRAGGAPYQIDATGAGYAMGLDESFLAIQEKLSEHGRQARLSQASIDILALVAYHQPVSRERLEALRGKASGGVLNQLVRRQLLRLERDPTTPRNPNYRTTDRFLRLLSLESLDDLPKTVDD